MGSGLKVRESGMPDTEIMVVAICNDESRAEVCKLQATGQIHRLHVGIKFYWNTAILVV